MRKGRYLVKIVSPVLGLICLLMAIGFAGQAARMALAGPGDVTARASVTNAQSSNISLTIASSSFTVAGPVNTAQTLTEAVKTTVITSNKTGYTLTIRGSGDFKGSLPNNTDTMPLANLSVAPKGGTTFTPLSLLDQVIIKTTKPTTPAGDAMSWDVKLNIPFVQEDTYSTTLTYTATNNP